MLNQGQQINARLYWLIHIGTWTIIAMASTAVFLAIYPFGLSLVRALGNLLPMIFLFYFNRFLVDWFYEKRRYILFLAINIALIFALIPLRVRFNLLFPDIPLTSKFDFDVQMRWQIITFTTNVMVTGLGAFYYILKNRYQVERENREKISQQNEAQLQFLRAQINPHFLFNTLNNIYSLAVVQSDKTADMVLKLSTLLRYVVYDGKAALVDLARELEHIQAYIELFQMRSETPLDISFQVEGELSQQQIEPMILIPLVENCFKHCDFELNPEAFIQLELTVDTNALHFRTLNTRSTLDLQKDQVGGVGLDNIQKRLMLKHPNQHQLSINPSDTQFEVSLTLTL